MKKKLTLLMVAILICVLVLSGCQSQQPVNPDNNEGEPTIDYPTREVRVIVPYDAGGTSDLVARAVADIARQNNLLSKPMIVTNMPGAGTVDGLNEVKGADPDGQVLTLHHTGFITGYSLGIVPWTYEEFEMIAQVAEIPSFLAVHNDAPWETLEDLIQDMKARPGQITVSLPAIGATTHFTYEMMANEAGVEGRIVVTGGTGQVASLLGKQTDVAVTAINQFISEKDAGNVRILAVASSKRLETIPDVPTFQELGIDLESYLRLGLFAPKGTPKEVISILEDMAESITKTDQFKRFAETQGLEVTFRNSEEFKSVFDSDNERISGVAATILEQQQNK